MRLRCRTAASIARSSCVAALAIAGCASVAPRAGEDPARWQPLSGPVAIADTAPGLSTLLVETAAGPAQGDDGMGRWTRSPVSIAWTDETLRLLVKYLQNPLRAARALALVHAAMHDAMALAASSGVAPEARPIAVHRAASLVLAHLYPLETPGRLEAMGLAAAVAVAVRAGISEQQFSIAMRCGSGAGNAVIHRALTDGSGRVWPVRLRPPDKPGQWRAAPPLNIYDPAEAFAGEWRTWVLEDGAEMQPPPPVKFDTPEYWKEVQRVVDVRRALTAQQKRIADDWNLDAGSVTPAGVWNLRARDLALARGLDDAATIRLFAALDVAMMDSLIACWHAKFTWWTLRPVNAARERIDANFLPYLYTPPFPSYVSGHATVSGAAAEVLGAFFPDQAAAFRAQAEEAARSRLYGGIHFRYDNQEGLALGRRVGDRVAERFGREAPQRAAALSTR